MFSKFNLKINQIIIFIKKYYKKIKKEGKIESNKYQKVGKKEKTSQLDEKSFKIIENEIFGSKISELVEEFIREGFINNSSDIHIEPLSRDINIRYRIDGQLISKKKLPQNLLSPLTNRIKILSGMDIAEKRFPQDGRFFIELEGIKGDIRVSTIPTIHGEKIVLRLLIKNSKKGFNITDLPEYEGLRIRNLLKRPHGLILITGPTGSGKSTTLYGAINFLNSKNRNIVTVEDPVEYTIDGINQINVNYKIGFTFSKGLKAILRQDPDIIMIGEIRDNETAVIAAQAAITGHLVLSTLHTNDAVSAILRLVDMGLEPYLVSSSIIGVIAQRLIRKVCKNCSESYKPSELEKKLLKTDGEMMLYKGKGCNLCSKTGYSGRCAIFEIIDIDDEIREMIVDNRSSSFIKEKCIERGMKTLKDACLELIRNGETTTEEFLRVAYNNEEGFYDTY